MVAASSLEEVQNSAYSLPAVLERGRTGTQPAKFQVGVVNKMANYVVTGGGGFIGSHIAEELLRRKQSVKIVDNFSTGKRENLTTFADNLEVVTTDISKTQDLARIFAGVDYVIHQAAIPS